MFLCHRLAILAEEVLYWHLIGFAIGLCQNKSNGRRFTVPARMSREDWPKGGQRT